MIFLSPVESAVDVQLVLLHNIGGNYCTLLCYWAVQWLLGLCFFFCGSRLLSRKIEVRNISLFLRNSLAIMWVKEVLQKQGRACENVLLVLETCSVTVVVGLTGHTYDTKTWSTNHQEKSHVKVLPTCLHMSWGSRKKFGFDMPLKRNKH